MTTAGSRHPDPSTLMSFAAGSLCEPLAAVVASHVCMCSECRAGVADLEMLGSALMAAAESSPGRFDRPMPVRPAGEAAIAISSKTVSQSDRLPHPIAAAFGLTFDTIRWRRLGPGVWHHRLPLSRGVEGDLRLLKIGSGRAMPVHGHGGSELTLVLDGAYSDITGEYRRGDVQDVDESVDHAPVADKALGCICLIASERPARFKSIVGKLMQPWTGI